MDVNRSPLVRTIFAIRTLPSRLLGEAPPQRSRSLVDETTAIGWRPLEEVPGRHLVMGAVTQPWAAAGRAASPCRLAVVAAWAGTDGGTLAQPASRAALSSRDRRRRMEERP